MLKSKSEIKKRQKIRIRKRVRKKIMGNPQRPRVFVLKSNRYMYTQVIDDSKGSILAAASTQEKGFRTQKKGTKNIDVCQRLGELLAKRLKEKKIEQVVFDRGVYPYHGRVKALADAIRKGGISF